MGSSPKGGEFLTNKWFCFSSAVRILPAFKAPNTCPASSRELFLTALSPGQMEKNPQSCWSQSPQTVLPVPPCLGFPLALYLGSTIFLLQVFPGSLLCVYNCCLFNPASPLAIAFT
jgi:hypothetical protein